MFINYVHHGHYYSKELQNGGWNDSSRVPKSIDRDKETDVQRGDETFSKITQMGQVEPLGIRQCDFLFGV